MKKSFFYLFVAVAVLAGAVFTAQAAEVPIAPAHHWEVVAITGNDTADVILNEDQSLSHSKSNPAVDDGDLFTDTEPGIAEVMPTSYIVIEARETSWDIDIGVVAIPTYAYAYFDLDDASQGQVSATGDASSFGERYKL